MSELENSSLSDINLNEVNLSHYPGFDVKLALSTSTGRKGVPIDGPEKNHDRAITPSQNSSDQEIDFGQGKVKIKLELIFVSLN